MQSTLARTVILCLIVFCVLIFRPATGWSQEPPEELRLIPKPRQLTIGTDRFVLDRRVRMVAADSRSEDDRFALQDFAADAKETAGVSLRLGRGRASRRIVIGKLELPQIQSRLKRAGLSIPTDMDPEGYLLSVTSTEVVIGGQTSAGVFYGLQTLKQLVQGEKDGAFIPAVQIVDWPAMRWRAVSDDISRGPVPTVDYIKRQLRTFAAFKLNMHSFYMEHAFASTAHPLIAPAGGSLTADEIRELVAYARRYHIELVPEQQTFGHLHKALKLEKYNVLAETPYGDVLSPQQEGSFQLVADWYRELDQLFPGKFFHIGADETFELGEGQSREAVKLRGVGAVYFEHLNRVRNVLLPYNRRLMFWGDIALNHPELIGNVPHDMIVMNWDYAPRDDFMSRIEPFKHAGLEQFVCPGVSNWNQVFPNLDNASKNITNFVRDGQLSGSLGMMNTSWDDDGETLFEMTWYGIVLGAAAAWSVGPVDIQGFDRAFDWAFFRSDDNQFVQGIRALGGVNTLLGIGTSNELFWRDPFTSSFQEQARTLAEKIKQMRMLVGAVDEAFLKNQHRARRNRSMIPVVRFAAQRFDHMGRRMQVVEKLSRDYWEAYLNLGDRAKVRRLRSHSGAIYNSMREMAEELATLRQSYREQWLAENRPYWLDSVLARYDRAIIVWLDKSKALEELRRNYEATSILPDPEVFGLGPRPAPATR